MPLPTHVDPHWASWFSGFIDGEGYFQIMPQSKGRFAVRLVLQLRQDDKPLLESIQHHLQCGNVYHVSKEYDREAGRQSVDQYMWYVQKIDEIANIIIPIFENHPLQSKKKKEFEIWREAAHMIYDGSNNTSRGRSKLGHLKERIMQQRKFETGKSNTEDEENGMDDKMPTLFE